MNATTKAERIAARKSALKACSKEYLTGEYRRHHRVSDVRELTKLDLVFALLRAEFGSLEAK